MISRPLIRKNAFRVLSRSTTQSTAFSTATRLHFPKVETPIQSQSTGSVAPPPTQPIPDANKVETPIQSVRPENVKSLPGGRPDRSNDKPLALFFGGLFVVPFICYYYWQYRAKHMDEKKARLLQEAREKYKNGG